MKLDIAKLAGAVMGVALLGVVLVVARREPAAAIEASTSVEPSASASDRSRPAPSAGQPASRTHGAAATELPPEVAEAIEQGPKEALVPPEITIEVAVAPGRGAVPGAEPLVPPVIEVGGEIAPGRGIKPTAEPLVPPVIGSDAPGPAER